MRVLMAISALFILVVVYSVREPIREFFYPLVNINPLDYLPRVEFHGPKKTIIDDLLNDEAIVPDSTSTEL